MIKNEPKLYGSTLVKAKMILDYLAKQINSTTLTKLSQEIGITKPTVRKIMDTLVYLNWVTETQNGFLLGTGVIQYAEAARNQFNIVQIAEPYLNRLSEKFGETINLVMPHGNHVILVNKYEGSHSVALKSVIGGQMDLYSTSVGKSILATYDDNKLNQYLAVTELKAKTSSTIDNAEDLRIELEKVRIRGFAYENEENEFEISCVGTSLEVGGQILGAFSISAPSYRVTDESMREFSRAILKTKAEILQKFN
ncbi:IclR family transcriptional regulator [Weissella coleopterorum]|uniref:IclR family transcriptional regulator n=1 Tax=Weissella coleopterorum TaxID=2714949 RepID=A0A6G8B1J6_9LACO|nr:IclR family transcriptional regulator [Weissella coleopterorum]QIL51184.1 IclR family transcriptional regulator [Weissella coleopterorum]